MFCEQNSMKLSNVVKIESFEYLLWEQNEGNIIWDFSRIIEFNFLYYL